MFIILNHLRVFKTPSCLNIMENPRKPNDYVEQLTNYVLKNLEKGYTIDALRVSLINQGYSRITIESAIEKANKKLAGRISPIKEKPQINYRIIPEPERRGFWETVKGWFR